MSSEYSSIPMSDHAHESNSIPSSLIEDDETIARRLQTSLGFDSEVDRRRQQELQDEELARQLSRSSGSVLQATQVSIPPINQQVSIKLFHPLSKSHIGESFYTQTISRNLLIFRVATSAGKYMCVRISDYLVVFENKNAPDDSCLFQHEVIEDGALYIYPKIINHGIAHTSSAVRCLSLANGILRADGIKGPASQWKMMASRAAVSNPTLYPQGYSDIQNPLLSNNSIQSPSNISGIVPRPPIASPQEILQWLRHTQEGQTLLRDPRLASVQFLISQEICILPILHRIDWIEVAKRYKDYRKITILPFDNQVATSYLSTESIKTYFQQGYLQFYDIIPLQQLFNLRKLVNFWLTHTKQYQFGWYQELNLQGNILADIDVLELFHTTPLIHIVQKLVGVQDINNVTTSHLVVIPPSYDSEIDSSSSIELSRRWMIDGFTSAGDHSPYTLTIGVALTDMSQVDRGNFCIHPNSHMDLQADFKSQVTARSNRFSTLNANKPCLQPPQQILLKQGDVFMCSHKLAYQFAKNNTCENTMLALFHISHVDHLQLKTPALDFPWVEYQSFSSID